jgi:hypothetical protein
MKTAGRPMGNDRFGHMTQEQREKEVGKNLAMDVIKDFLCANSKIYF